jgi:hypothetical protein
LKRKEVKNTKIINKILDKRFTPAALELHCSNIKENFTDKNNKNAIEIHIERTFVLF